MAFPTTTSLNSKIVHAYKLSETSGQRNDSEGSIHLTDNNTVGYNASGKDGNAADFVQANSESLTNSALNTLGTGDISVAFWAYIDTNGGNYQGLVRLGLADAWSDRSPLAAYLTGTRAPYLQAGTSTSNVSARGASTVAAGWHHFVIMRDTSGARVVLKSSIDGETIVVSSAASGGDEEAPDRLFLGTIYLGGSTSYYVQGRLDEVYVFNSLLTQTEVNALAGGEYYSASSGVSGSLAVTLDAATLAGTGTVDVAGTASATLGAATVAGTGTVDVQASAAVTLGALTSAATGTVEAKGTAAVTFGAATLAATGTVGSVPIEGTLSVTLGALTVSGTAAVDVQGQTSATLGAVTLAGTGVIGAAVSGTLSVTLDAATAAGTGTVAVAGSTSVTLGALSTTATGTVEVKGSVAATLGAATLVASGAVGFIPTEGTLSVTLGVLTSSATGTVAAQAALAAQLGALAIAATGAVEVKGALSVTLGALWLDSGIQATARPGDLYSAVITESRYRAVLAASITSSVITEG